MSYSRWTNSNWYSYWSTASGKTKNEQILYLGHVSVCDTNSEYSYLELLDMTPSLLNVMFDRKLSRHDIDEAMDIIKLFLEEVEEEFIYDEV